MSRWVVVSALLGLAASPAAALEQVGRVRGRGAPIEGATVTLYRAGAEPGAGAVALGSAVTGRDGRFRIEYAPPGAGAVLYLVADGPRRGVRLATVAGTDGPRFVTINERSTVATAFTMARFVDGAAIGGNDVGVRNAAAILRNLVDVETGGVARMLATPPNGPRTSTLRTFNSLANMLAACVDAPPFCPVLFAFAAPPGGPFPRDTLAAAAAIARSPANNAGLLWVLSFAAHREGPALGLPPTSWVLALKYVGNGREFDGPGNIAFDADGNAWVTNNYVFRRNHARPTCGGDTLIRLTPDGSDFPGAPYTGGGLDGAGFGITLDPRGNVWVGNFGFFGSTCPEDRRPAANSVSLFDPDGVALSPDGSPECPDGGFCQGGIRSPQGTVSDRDGDIWIANTCGASVTRYLSGDPDDREVTDLDAIGDVESPSKPFDIAIDADGGAWVTDNFNDRVLRLAPDGTPSGPPITAPGIRRPLGVAVDSLGNAWVASTGVLDVPCPGSPAPGALVPALDPDAAGVTLIGPAGDVVASFQGRDLLLPWGVAIDGDDNVWVANFAGHRLAHLCGANPARCPPGVGTGDPISPPAGYRSDALVRNTGLAVDPSGNVWVANNWLDVPVQTNPGGDGLVVFIGVAAPVRTPLIGPPQRP